MNDWSGLFLGIIALSVLVMAVIQVGAIILLARAMKKMMAITEDLQREIKPLAAKVHAIADDAKRAAALAGKQAERIDALVADVSQRVQDTTAAVQTLITSPIRQGASLFGGLRDMIAAILTTEPRKPAHRDEGEDALFVG